MRKKSGAIILSAIAIMVIVLCTLIPVAKRFIDANASLLTFVGILTTLIGGFLSSVLYELILRFRLKPKEETIEQRIKRLSGSLIEATNLIGQIEQEINNRRVLVEKLENDIEIYDQIVRLKQSEVEAVTQVLRKELRTESDRSFRRAVVVNSLFFVLGAAFSFILIVIL